jgi:hypothetical protein
MDVTGLLLLIIGLGGGLGLCCYLLAADRQRFLAGFEVKQWREAYYLRALPNFLQGLHDRHFVSAWPARRNAVAAAFFKWRVRPLLKKRSAPLRRAFLQQHITLFALLEKLAPYLRDYVLHEEQRIIGERIVEMEDTLDRDRLIAYLEAVREERKRFVSTMTGEDRATLAMMTERGILAKFRTAHAIFQEHGYELLPVLTRLRHWQEMTGVELVQELPEVAVRRERVRRQARVG